MHEDPFAAGLRAYFDQHPDVYPATVSAAAGLNKSAIRKIISGEVKSPRRANAESIALQLGLSVERIIAQDFSDSAKSISIVGEVGAGAHVDLFDEVENGSHREEIGVPENLKDEEIAAVRVVGDSMEPVYSEGDILFFTRQTHEGVPVEAINRKCIVATPDGKAWVKHLKYGSEEGKFHLTSINPTGENRHNTDVLWATPVRLHLPAEFVKRQR
ncbi:S24 family peptidase [Thioclava sp. GXIMD2076]|uniref:S24 family peptidase n=1 Tax=unclassified Thioclava TaxID=2621713 RepID=UPI0030CFF4A9